MLTDCSLSRWEVDKVPMTSSRSRTESVTFSDLRSLSAGGGRGAPLHNGKENTDKCELTVAQKVPVLL